MLDAHLPADPGVKSSIPAQSHTFVEIDHEIISMSFSIPLIHSKRVVVRYKRTCVHKLLVNRFFKLGQEKVWLGELAAMTIAVDWDIKQQNKQTNP